MPHELVGNESRRISGKALGIGIATGAYGLSFGAISVASGLSALQTQALSLLMFTGASQFALVGVLGAGSGLGVSGLIPVADGYVALGCVIRGETYHFEIVANESARGLMSLAVTQGLAIGNGILTVETEEQAWARAPDGQDNKGAGAANACLAVIRHRAHLMRPKS